MSNVAALVSERCEDLNCGGVSHSPGSTGAETPESWNRWSDVSDGLEG